MASLYIYRRNGQSRPTTLLFARQFLKNRIAAKNPALPRSRYRTISRPSETVTQVFRRPAIRKNYRLSYTICKNTTQNIYKNNKQNNRLQNKKQYRVATVSLKNNNAITYRSGTKTDRVKHHTGSKTCFSNT